MDLRVGTKYRLGQKLGQGAFGEVYRGTNIYTNETVAIKLERCTTNNSQLLFEGKLYKILNCCCINNIIGVPKIMWYGIEGDYNVMVLELLGPSLEELFNYCGRKFTLKTILMLLDQLLCRLEFIHDNDIIHRDIKPSNIVMGTNIKSHHVYIIDFGLGKKYINSKTREHIPYKRNKSMIGTARYSSINNDIGIEQSRRDDLEGLANTIAYLIKGGLPWQGIKGVTREEKYNQIVDKKIATSPEELFEGYPHEFVILLSYSRGLRFEERPNYCYLKKIFRELFSREGFEMDYIYNWVLCGIQTLIEEKSVAADRDGYDCIIAGSSTGEMGDMSF